MRPLQGEMILRCPSSSPQGTRRERQGGRLRGGGEITETRNGREEGKEYREISCRTRDHASPSLRSRVKAKRKDLNFISHLHRDNAAYIAAPRGERGKAARAAPGAVRGKCIPASSGSHAATYLSVNILI